MSSLGDALAAQMLLAALEQVGRIEEKLDEVLQNQEIQGALMVTQAEAITAVAAKVTDILADFRAFRDAMLAERENLTEAGQAALDAANAVVTELDTEVGDADGSDAPPPPPLP